MGFEEITERLANEIEHVREFYNNPPPNEANTLDWVIRPLLIAAGYSETDILRESTGPGNQRPDYTLLWETPHTWYLEAKDWSRPLGKGPDIVQAVNYANAEGKRWVVLSNGDEWILFDNHISHAPAEERAAAKVRLQDNDFIEFMLAISKDSMLEDSMERYAIRRKITETLDEQLKSPASGIIIAICRQLRRETEQSGIAAADVVRYFTNALRIAVPTEQVDEIASELMATPKPEAVEVAPERSLYVRTLAELDIDPHQAVHTKPVRITFPDNTAEPVNRWFSVSKELVLWVWKNRALPELPYRALEEGRNLFLSSDPFPQRGSYRIDHPLVHNDVTIYINVLLQSRALIISLSNFCSDCGVPADQIRIEYMK